MTLIIIDNFGRIKYFGNGYTFRVKKFGLIKRFLTNHNYGLEFLSSFGPLREGRTYYFNKKESAEALKDYIINKIDSDRYTLDLRKIMKEILEKDKMN